VSSLEKGKRHSDEGDAFWLNTEGGVRHPVQRRESELGIKGESRLGCRLSEDKGWTGFDPEIRRSFSPSSTFHRAPRVSSWERSRKVCFLPTFARIRRFSHGVGISDVGLRLATNGVLTKACPPAGSPHRFLALFIGWTLSAVPSFPRQPQIRSDCHHGSDDQPLLEALQTCWSYHRPGPRASTILSTSHS